MLSVGLYSYGPLSLNLLPCRCTSTCGHSTMTRVNGQTLGDSIRHVSSTTKATLSPRATKTDASCFPLVLVDASVLEKFWLRTGCSSLPQRWCSGFTLSRRTVIICLKSIRGRTKWDSFYTPSHSDCASKLGAEKLRACSTLQRMELKWWRITMDHDRWNSAENGVEMVALYNGP